MLTVDFTKFPVKPGDLVLDLGCGAGRHAFEAYRRGARVVAADLDHKELPPVAGMFGAMRAEGEVTPESQATALAADATNLPFPDGAFDAVIAAEILEHIPADSAAFAEIARVLRPGGAVAVTVPAWLPERICWALSREYHEVPGGHVRIFTRAELDAKLTAAGLLPAGLHHAHGLHSAYWWLKCAVGVHHDKHPAVAAYHRLLVWDIMRAPALTRRTEAALNPLIGKSLVIYARKSEEPIIPNGPVGQHHTGGIFSRSALRSIARSCTRSRTMIAGWARPIIPNGPVGQHHTGGIFSRSALRSIARSCTRSRTMMAGWARPIIPNGPVVPRHADR